MTKTNISLYDNLLSMDWRPRLDRVSTRNAKRTDLRARNSFQIQGVAQVPQIAVANFHLTNLGQPTETFERHFGKILGSSSYFPNRRIQLRARSSSNQEHLHPWACGNSLFRQAFSLVLPIKPTPIENITTTFPILGVYSISSIR
ncbi:hypothetical protein [Edaphobacter modestus]|uniref:Uncharacterized protein n=1 Tax=Edaphobacter modestus TaxID=388466 RepID=A0A4Q7YSZ6_9BACT|nr:hypothetical protein [Edaphobacter modestus]RZU39985.1 hypothetical protein BDD14_1398 [Edaphobacter modestus]